MQDCNAPALFGDQNRRAVRQIIRPPDALHTQQLQSIFADAHRLERCQNFQRLTLPEGRSRDAGQRNAKPRVCKRGCKGACRNRTQASAPDDIDDTRSNQPGRDAERNRSAKCAWRGEGEYQESDEQCATRRGRQRSCGVQQRRRTPAEPWAKRHKDKQRKKKRYEQDIEVRRTDREAHEARNVESRLADGERFHVLPDLEHRNGSRRRDSNELRLRPLRCFLGKTGGARSQARRREDRKARRPLQQRGLHQQTMALRG